MNTPSFSLSSAVLNILSSLIIASTASFIDGFSFNIISFTKLCSGANTTYVTPYNVSDLVVNAGIVMSSPFSIGNLKSTSVPNDFPIQFFCIVNTCSGQ